MAIKVDRLNGQNYAENIVDELLMFESGTWTVASGTGTASLDTNNSFVGSSSLKVENNVPASAITVSNSTQETTIATVDNYQLSWYIKKDIAEEREGSVLIYKNAVLLDTQDFSITETDEWVRFQGGQSYALGKGDVITFQFKLKSATTTELTTYIYVDGVMVNKAERGNTIVPFYTRPITETVQAYGTYDYQDTATAITPIVLLIDTWTDLTNNGLGVNTSVVNGLTGVNIYNPLTGLFDFSGLEIGDFVNMRVDVYPVLSTNNNVVNLELLGGIGGTQFSIPIVSDKYYKTSGTKRVTIYTGVEMKSTSTLINPAKLRIKCDAAATCIVNGWLIKVDKKRI